MSPKREETSRVGCGSPTAHNEHLCRMMEQGKTAEVRKVAGDAYVCVNCGAKAAVKEVLCKPREAQAE